MCIFSDLSLSQNYGKLKLRERLSDSPEVTQLVRHSCMIYTKGGLLLNCLLLHFAVS